MKAGRTLSSSVLRQWRITRCDRLAPSVIWRAAHRAVLRWRQIMRSHAEVSLPPSACQRCITRSKRLAHAILWRAALSGCARLSQPLCAKLTGTTSGSGLLGALRSAFLSISKCLLTAAPILTGHELTLDPS
jgi:hypothetical protein